MLAMSVGLLAALALPHTAPAAWKHHKTVIQKDVQIGLTGQVRVASGAGGVECQITSRVKFLQGQTTGTVETFAQDNGTVTQRCKGTGALGGCQVHELKVVGLPWVLHTSAANQTGDGTKHPDRIEIKAGEITSTLQGAFCLTVHVSATVGTIFATPDKIETASSVGLSGAFKIHVAGLEEDGKASGTLQIEEPDQATYSI